MSTVVVLPRSAWTTHPPVRRPAPMPREGVAGLALHWPGTKAPIGAASQRAIAERLEGYRRDHVQRRGWNDIAYQEAVDQAGRIWELRGLTNRSAGNGDVQPNMRYGAVLVLVGPGEALTPACLAALRHLWRHRWLRLYPHAGRLVEHRDVRPEPTECPGPAVRAAIDSGAITHPPAPAPAPTPRPPTTRPPAPTRLEEPSVIIVHAQDTGRFYLAFAGGTARYIDQPATLHALRAAGVGEAHIPKEADVRELWTITTAAS